MRIRHLSISGLCLISVLSLGLRAQDTAQPKKVPHLTMDDLDSRVPASPAGNTAPTTSGTNPELSSSGAKNVLESAWKKMANLKSGRMKFSNQTASGASEMLYEFAPASRVRMVKDGLEMIVVGPTVYMRAQGQEWKKSTKEQVFKSADVSFKSFTNFSAEKTAQIQLVGEESLNQIPTLKFKVVEANNNTSYTWIGKNDGFVYKMEASMASSGQVVTTVFSDFNTEIAIASPEQEN
ncbi:MAG: hypothetical protein JST84_25795 [Acidobacteria bacterium]|nr:hypothetical protein [Acidobacteriota bacterium]